MALKLHNVLYPNVGGGGDIGLILDLYIIGLMTTKHCAANCKWKFVCFGQLRGFLVFLCYEFACCVISRFQARHCLTQTASIGCVTTRKSEYLHLCICICLHAF